MGMKNPSGEPARGSNPPPPARVTRVLSGIRTWTLPLGLLLFAGCASAPREEASPPAGNDGIVALHFNDAAVPAAPLREMMDGIRQYFARKQGKEVLIGGAALIFGCIVISIVFLILRGSSVASSNDRLRKEDSNTPSHGDGGTSMPVLEASQRSQS
jgi:hypothetical protein